MFGLTFRQSIRISTQRVNKLLSTSGVLVSRNFQANMSQEPQYPPIETAMRKALTAELKPIFLDVSNESPMHNTPKQAESHFRVLVVSDKFNDLTLIKVSSGKLIIKRRTKLYFPYSAIDWLMTQSRRR